MSPTCRPPPAVRRTMATVFISHAGEDTATALLVAGWLTDEHHAVRLDRHPDHGIVLGDEWGRRLYAWLREADAMVCILTSRYSRSEWCTAELGAARAQGC